MDYQTILTSPLISKAELARKMWPGVKSADKKLLHKIAGRAGQRLTDQDQQLIVDIFLKEFPIIAGKAI